MNAPRPRVLLIPNNSHWILGQMCDHVRVALGGQFDFFQVPETLFEARPQLWDKLLPEVDLVHCVNESSGGVLARSGAAGRAGVPVLTWIHHVTQWSQDHRDSCAVSAAIVACTEGWREALAAYTDKPVYAVRHGVDAVRFAPVAAARARLGIPAQDFVVGFFGSKGSDTDQNRKGMPTFLEVVRRSGQTIPNLRILLLGPGWDQDVAAFEAAGIRVTYPGYLPAGDLAAAYSALDLYLMTATVEGGPCTVLEAMACGTPVVATRVGLVPDVVVDGVNGLSVEVGDVAAMTAAVQQLAAGPALRQRMSAQARLDAAQLTWPRMLAPLAEIYRAVLRPGRIANRTLDPARINQDALAAEAILALRYSLARKGWRNSGKSLRAVWRAANGPSSLIRGLRMAARGEL